MKELNAGEVKAIFDRDGYVCLRGFMNQNEVAELNDKLAKFITHIAPTLPPEHAFFEGDPPALKQLFHLSHYDDFFEQLLNNSKLQTIAEQLLAEKAGKSHLEYFNKSPGANTPTPAHQDAYYFMINPPSALTLWLPLEDVDEENGCLSYIRGSHLLGMRPHGRTKILGFSQGITDFGTDKDKEHEVFMPARKGDLLIHHCMTVHRANANKSPTRSRRVLGFVYFGESAQEDRKAKSDYQRELNGK